MQPTRKIGPLGGRRLWLILACAAAWLAFTLAPAPLRAAEPGHVLHALFLGGDGHHDPLARSKQLIPYLLHRGIAVTYTDDPNDLNPETLGRYDALILYANIDTITKPQADALLGYVERGGGFVPIHCASYCFRNDPRIIALIGGEFQSHHTGVFRTRIIAPDHPVMQGFKGFESWDETYVHSHHNPVNRTVLSVRGEEPYTWVRAQGKGRVFYTAWGHDQRTWGNPGFLDLIERGLRWAMGDDHPADTIARRPVLKPFEYVNAKVPWYHAGGPPRGGDVWKKMPEPLPPAESMKHMVVPGGFEVKLFAAEPQIYKPLCMAWDERGRCWIGESVDYPNNLQPLGEGHDRIVICEDTDSDGRADKFTVFADKLSIPSSITFWNGGVIVQSAPNTLFLKSTHGNDHADVRRVLFTGWGTRDTHAGPNNLHYGLDNWVWGMVGYSGFDGAVGGVKHEFHMGFYRFRPGPPEPPTLEFLRSTNNNTWGFGQSEEGLVFCSTANNNPSDFMPIANRYYEVVPNFKPSVLSNIADSARFLPITTNVRQVDVWGGYTAGTGHELYTARQYPRSYWNRTAFVAEPTGHLIGMFNLTSRGADFRSHNPSNLLASDDEWTSPIAAAVGPDGNVWFIDWYNYIIQHNPTPAGFKTGKGSAYENPLRDKVHGRIYRIVYTGPGARPPARHLTLAGADPATLIATLKNNNMFWRLQAQRLLVERGKKDIVPALLKLVEDHGVDELRLNVGAIHALWTLQGLGAFDGADPAATAALLGALHHPSAGVRRNAVKVLALTRAKADDVLAAHLLNDPDAQVRLAALLALADLPPSDAAGRAIAAMLKRPEDSGDRWIVDAATAAAQRDSAGFFAAASQSSVAETGLPNLLKNGSFESGDADLPAGWSTVTYSGKASFAKISDARDGREAVRITATGDGADASWSVRVGVKPHTRYRLSGWIKTDSVRDTHAGLGAMLEVHELQHAAMTTPLKGTHGWTRVSTEFDSGGHASLQVNGLFGGWGRCVGAASYDGVRLTEFGASDGVTTVLHRLRAGTANPRVAVTGHGSERVIRLNVVPGAMKYDHVELTVRAGEKIDLVLGNTDQMQHNFVLLKSGTLERFGSAADRFATNPEAMTKDFVPDSPDVLAKMPMVNPFTHAELHFTAPAAPGRYPYVCTFPGHWRMMQGVLIVKPEK